MAYPQGVEPCSLVLETNVLPNKLRIYGGKDRIRTYVGITDRFTVDSL